MSFFLDFVGGIIAQLMEDPEYNKRAWDEHIRDVEQRAQERLEAWNSPKHPWGYWRTKLHNAIYEQKMHPAYKLYPGRRDSKAEY